MTEHRVLVGASANARGVLLLFGVGLGDGHEGTRLTLHLLQGDALPEFLQLVFEFVLFVNVSLLVHPFTRPEEAGDILGGRLNDCVCFDCIELPEQLVGQ